MTGMALLMEDDPQMELFDLDDETWGWDLLGPDLLPEQVRRDWRRAHWLQTH